MAIKRALTVTELIDHLTEYREVAGGDTEVRLATSKSWPFEDSVSGVAISRPTQERPSFVYLAQGDQIGYLSSEAREALGWD